MGVKNEFGSAMVNEPSVLESLKFYCIKCVVWKNHISGGHFDLKIFASKGVIFTRKCSIRLEQLPLKSG